MSNRRKKELREQVKKRKMDRFAENDTEYYHLASEMLSKVLDFPLFRKASHVALFASKKASLEIHTDELISRSIEMGKHVFLPRCITSTHDLEYVEIKDIKNDVEIGTYSLREPKKNLLIQKQELVLRKLDLVFVPGVAFDTKGNRLGFGSGYYDNFLRSLRKDHPKTQVIALAFDFQVFDFEIPHNAKDEIVDYIITSTAIFKTNK